MGLSGGGVHQIGLEVVGQGPPVPSQFRHGGRVRGQVTYQDGQPAKGQPSPPQVPQIDPVVPGEVGLHRVGNLPEQAEEACYSPGLRKP